MTTRTVVSTDGTAIGATVMGQGPPVVVIPGSVATGQQWRRVAQELSSDRNDPRTVWLVDRRGRGSSGDTLPYSLDAEVRDVAAVVDAAGPQATLVGHSFGAVVVMETLRAGVTPASAVVYEPPFLIHSPETPALTRNDLNRFATLTDADPDEGLRFALTTLVGTPPDQVERLRSSSGWLHMVELTPTWVREAYGLAELPPDLSRYADITVPLTVLVGEQTAAHHAAAARALAQAVPGAQMVVLPRQGHFAHTSDPELVARAIRAAG